MTDCRCAECGCCKHDHGGWKHEWRAAPDWNCPTCGPVRLELHPKSGDYRFPKYRCSNCKEWTDLEWYDRLGRNSE